MPTHRDCGTCADDEPSPPRIAGQTCVMDQEQQEAFAAAVERKKREAETRSHDPGPPPDGESAIEGEQRRVSGVRDTSTGKGKKTADKWNQ